MITAPASDVKNNFGYYLDAALVDGEVYITRFGRVIARLVSVKSGQFIIDQKKPYGSAKDDKKSL